MNERDGTVNAAGFLRVLAVDDEPPALDELAYHLRADPRVARLHTAGDATEALRLLRDTDVDVVFLDIRMPGLDGMELARVLRRFARPPRSSSSPRTTTARWTPSTWAPPTTCANRYAPNGWPSRCAG